MYIKFNQRLIISYVHEVLNHGSIYNNGKRPSEWPQIVDSETYCAHIHLIKFNFKI